MSRDPVHWYRQILDACAAAHDLVHRGRPAFDEDLLLQRAAKNICFEVGEAAKQIAALDPEELARTDYERWPLVIRMRDFYGHNHPGADPDVLWDTIETDLPVIDASATHRLDEING